MKAFLNRSARPIEILIGLVFIIGVFLKAADINMFAVQIAAYGVLPDKAMLGPAALITVSLECFLGVSLILALRAGGWTYAALMALLFVFTGLILYGWLANDLEDCGCFGALEMSPPISIAKNMVLLALVLLTWVGMAKRAGRKTKQRWLPRLVIVILLTVFVQAYAYAHLTRVPRTGKFSGIVVRTENGPVALGEGEHLVAMLSMDCEHCMAAVPGLNNLFFNPGLPQLVALCLEEQPGDMVNFRAAVMPQFPMGLVEDDLLFFNLIGQSPPRIWYVKDGLGLAYWDGEAPDQAEILAAIAGQHNGMEPATLTPSP